MRTPIVSMRLVLPDRELILQHEPESTPVSPLIHLQGYDLGFPNIRDVAEDVPGGDGTDDDTELIGARAVSITAKLWGDATTRPFALLGELRRFCQPRKRPELRYRVDGEDTERRVVLRADTQSAPITREARTWIECQTSWVCPSGIQESALEQLVTVLPLTEAPGAPVPWDVPLDLPAISGGGPTSASNDGDYPAFWTARIYGPATSIRLRNLTTGAQVYLPFAVIGGDGEYLELNAQSRTALMSGDPSANRYDLIDFTTSTWWQLEPGANELEFSALDWDSPAQVAFTWRHTYL